MRRCLEVMHEELDVVPEMSTVVNHPALHTLVRRMLEKLEANEHKGGWESCDTQWLLDQVRGEIEELIVAWEEGTADEVLSEAADVANFVMMFADNVGREMS